MSLLVLSRISYLGGIVIVQESLRTLSEPSLEEQLSKDRNHISLMAWKLVTFVTLYLSFHNFPDSAENIHLEELKQ